MRAGSESAAKLHRLLLKLLIVHLLILRFQRTDGIHTRLHLLNESSVG